MVTRKFRKKERPEDKPRDVAPETQRKDPISKAVGKGSLFTAPIQAIEKGLKKVGVPTGPKVSLRPVHAAVAGAVFAPAMTTGISADTLQLKEYFKMSKKDVPGNIKGAGKLTSDITRYATNEKTLRKTATWITRLGRKLKSPTIVAGALIGAIGSYPFAGFIKEEALQTLGFGINAAKEGGDLEGEQAAIDLQEEILDPGLWTDITNKIPYANVLGQLNKFYEAARQKLEIDKTDFERRKAGEGTPEDIKFQGIAEADRADSAFFELKKLRKKPKEFRSEEDQARFERVEALARTSNLFIE